VPRPFRHTPPTPQGTVARPRLQSQLDQRWNRRLTTITAGPGFGKTVLLSTALDAHQGPGRDLWLSCEPADASAGHLVQSLAEAMGLGAPTGLDGLVQAVWSRAPEPLCLVLDDVHEIPVDSDGARALERLVIELPHNGHLVLASRDQVPVRIARLAATGELNRIVEADLILDDDELDAFARARHVERSLLDSTGGWPALAELTASTGADLVLDYLWEEVLERLGAPRTRQLAQLAVVGGADDEIVSALAGRPVRVDDLISGIPLVERSADGTVSLHALWGPALRRRLDDGEATRARRVAAAIQRGRGHYQAAIDLLAEAEAWDEILAMVRDAEVHMIAPTSAADLMRWCDTLPNERRHEPEVLLASALGRRTYEALESVPMLVAARAAFAARGDVDGEAAALAHEGLIRWWSHDIANLATIIERIELLAEQGSAASRSLMAIGAAAVAHLAGDSDAVRSHLDDVDDHLPGAWQATVQWLRSVAHRRDGDLVAARRALEAAPAAAIEGSMLELESAALRTEWLGGAVDETCAGWHAHCEQYAEIRDSYTRREVQLELARSDAWLGRPEAARNLLAEAQAVTQMESPLSRILASMAAAAIALAEGDEAEAADLVRPTVLAALGTSESWYWRDRATIALTHVLVPESREPWAREQLGAAHRPGLELAVVLEAARAGNLDPVRSLAWPAPGVVRAHLPVRWVAELISAASASGAPAPTDLVRALGAELRTMLRHLADDHPVPAIADAAARLAARLPPLPSAMVRIGVLGPLVVELDGVPVDAPELQRRRVRELLCTMVAHTRMRREALATQLWPDHPDPRQNLRVTLAYLQRVLQPDRDPGEPPYFLRTDGSYLRLEGGEHLEVDVWALEALLDQGEAADRAAAPADALAAYRSAVPLWRGEPFADGPDAEWVGAERARLTSRFVAGALRAGELLLATGERVEARRAGECALVAERWCEPAYQLIMRTHLAEGDRAAAERTLAACRAALAELDLEPEATTVDLVAHRA
jgi:LuxR family transcriptional regulator, maltose regulon positive regulatory protein